MSNDVEKVLKENPTFLRVVHCWNLIQYFRTAQTDLTDFLVKYENFVSLINLIHVQKDKNIIRVISSLFLSTNTSLLEQFTQNPDYLSKLIHFPEQQKKVKLFPVSTCFNILFQAFNNWPSEMFKILNSSIDAAPLIVNNLTTLAVESFATGIVEKSSDSMAFVWFCYAALMGNAGTGGQPPQRIANEKIINPNCSMPSAKIHTITQQHKNIILRIMRMFFDLYNQETVTAEFAEIASMALPVMIRKADSDDERLLIFQLATKLPKNEAMVKCADSILFSNCKTIFLIEAALQYLIVYPQSPNIDSLELLMFDVLNRRINVFLANSFMTYFRKQLEGFDLTKEFVDHVRNIIIYSMRSKKSTLLLRAIRVDIVNAINKLDTFLDVDEFEVEINRQRGNICSSSYDQEKIKKLKIQLADNSGKSPIYDPIILWGPKANVYESHFNGISHPKLNNKNNNFSSTTKANHGFGSVSRKNFASTFNSHSGRMRLQDALIPDNGNDSLSDEGINSDSEALSKKRNRRSSLSKTKQNDTDEILLSLENFSISESSSSSNLSEAAQNISMVTSKSLTRIETGSPKPKAKTRTRQLVKKTQLIRKTNKNSKTNDTSRYQHFISKKPTEKPQARVVNLKKPVKSTTTNTTEQQKSNPPASTTSNTSTTPITTTQSSDSNTLSNANNADNTFIQNITESITNIMDNSHISSQIANNQTTSTQNNNKSGLVITINSSHPAQSTAKQNNGKISKTTSNGNLSNTSANNNSKIKTAKNTINTNNPNTNANLHKNNSPHNATSKVNITVHTNTTGNFPVSTINSPSNDEGQTNQENPLMVPTIYINSIRNSPDSLNSPAHSNTERSNYPIPVAPTSKSGVNKQVLTPRARALSNHNQTAKQNTNEENTANTSDNLRKPTTVRRRSIGVASKKVNNTPSSRQNIRMSTRINKSTGFLRS